MIIIPFNDKCIAMPIDTLLVFEMNDENNLEGGSGEDLADQITNVLQKRLEIDEEKIITSEVTYYYVLHLTEVKIS